MSDPSALDAPLNVTEGKILVVQDAEGNPAQGSVTMEYYVDKDGVPRFPNILASDSPAVSQSALLTLEQLRFTPPRQAGKPTYVKVKQPFRFGP